MNDADFFQSDVSKKTVLTLTYIKNYIKKALSH